MVIQYFFSMLVEIISYPTLTNGLNYA